MHIKKLSNLVILVIPLIIIILVSFAFLFVTRYINASTVQHQIIVPKTGVECVVVTTTDGAAVDCWKQD